jgi:hypothetical protein
MKTRTQVNAFLETECWRQTLSASTSLRESWKGGRETHVKKLKSILYKADLTYFLKPRAIAEKR